MGLKTHMTVFTRDTLIFLHRTLESHSAGIAISPECHVDIWTMTGDIKRFYDVEDIIDDFEVLGADPGHVGEALGALMLTAFGIEHAVPTHGLTIALCGSAA